MLLILLIRGVTLPGASRGIHFYLYPDLGRLSDPQVGWIALTFRFTCMPAVYQLFNIFQYVFNMLCKLVQFWFGILSPTD